MCNNCCCCSSIPPTPPGNGPEKPSLCTHFQVTFNSIEVSDIDDGIFGFVLDTEWTFVVNGQVRTRTIDPLDVGTHTIGVSFIVDVPTASSLIDIRVSGVENDFGFDDPLPEFTKTWDSAHDFGQGAQSQSGRNSSITYRMNYTISCAQPVTVAIARETLLAYAQERLEIRKSNKTLTLPTPPMLLSRSLERLRRDNWDLIHVTEREYIFKGYGNLPQLLEQRYGSKTKTEPRKKV